MALFEEHLGIKAIYHRALSMPEGDKVNRDGTPGPGHMRHMTFCELYRQVIRHLRLRSNLTDRKVRDLAARCRYDAKMVRDTPEGAKEFLKQYRAGLVKLERAHTRSNLRSLVNIATRTGGAAPFVAMLQHEANNAEEDQMRDFLNRLQPSVRNFIEMQIRRPTSVVEMEALVMHWCDMTHGRQGGVQGRINELSIAPSHSDEPLVQPGLL